MGHDVRPFRSSGSDSPDEMNWIALRYWNEAMQHQTAAAVRVRCVAAHPSGFAATEVVQRRVDEGGENSIRIRSNKEIDQVAPWHPIKDAGARDQKSQQLRVALEAEYRVGGVRTM